MPAAALTVELVELRALPVAGAVDRETFSRLLAGAIHGAAAPDVDLLIRTGGEQRISNFLLWNLAYTELYFCDALWPDFDEAGFDSALAWFARRERRFGLTGDGASQA